MIALNRGDLDQLFSELTAPAAVENRSRSIFRIARPPNFAPARRASRHGRLGADVDSAICWLSPTVVVTRLEREGVGPDDEQYAWARLYVTEFRDGRLTSMCEFELDDEERRSLTPRNACGQLQSAGSNEPRQRGRRSVLLNARCGRGTSTRPSRPTRIGSCMTTVGGSAVIRSTTGPECGLQSSESSSSTPFREPHTGGARRRLQSGVEADGRTTPGTRRPTTSDRNRR